jgi:hypothetical protein
VDGSALAAILPHRSWRLSTSRLRRSSGWGVLLVRMRGDGCGSVSQCGACGRGGGWLVRGDGDGPAASNDTLAAGGSQESPAVAASVSEGQVETSRMGMRVRGGPRPSFMSRNWNRPDIDDEDLKRIIGQIRSLLPRRPLGR